MGEEEKRTDVAPDVVNQSEDEIIDPLTELEFQRERTLAGIKNTDQFCELLDVGCEGRGFSLEQLTLLTRI